jgi:membrane associated rhomboid family serine protease
MLLPYHDENPTERFPWLTILLIATNVWVFIRMIQLPEREMEYRYFRYGFVPLRLTQLYTGRAVKIEERYLPAVLRDSLERQDRPGFWFWRSLPRSPQPREVILEPEPASQVLRSLITCMFLHGSWLHLIGNMWFFWIFGNNVEDRLGPVRFLTFYLTGGILATLFHYAAYPLSPIPVVGASGAISAVMGAYLITWPGAMIRCLVLIVFWLTVVSLPAWFFITLWFLGQILGVLGPDSGQLGGGVAWWAHIGGFISGIGLMYLLAPQDDR